jgi:hypothetical protein
MPHAANPFCQSCGHEHGPLYICPSYDDATKAELKLKAARLRWYGIQNLYDREWMRDFVKRLRLRPESVRIQAIAQT